MLGIIEKPLAALARQAGLNCPALSPAACDKVVKRKRLLRLMGGKGLQYQALFPLLFSTESSAHSFIMNLSPQETQRPTSIKPFFSTVVIIFFSVCLIGCNFTERMMNLALDTR